VNLPNTGGFILSKSQIIEHERERQRRERERQRRAEQSRRDQASYTIDEWCDRRRISRAMFYRLKNLKLAPRIHYAGAKPIISDEADREWLAAREAEAAAA
jgi:hypothetical protein